MKKIAFVLAIVMVLSMPLSAKAAEPRMTTVYPTISVNATLATFGVQAIGDNMSEYLKATIRLYRENTLIGSWYVDGYGYIDFSETKSVRSGYTYKLTVDLTVDGVAVPQVTAST